MFTETLALAVAAPGIVAIREPTAGALEYVTVLSVHELPTDLTLPATAEPSDDTNSLRTAEAILAPAGRLERLKRKRARRVGVPPRSDSVRLEPKLVDG